VTKIILGIILIRKIKAAAYAKASVNLCHSTRHQISEDSSVHSAPYVQWFGSYTELWEFYHPIDLLYHNAHCVYPEWELRNPFLFELKLAGAFRKIAISDYWFVVSFSVSLFVRPSVWNNSASTRGIFTQFNTCGFFENLLRELKFN